MDTKALACLALSLLAPAAFGQDELAPAIIRHAGTGSLVVLNKSDGTISLLDAETGQQRALLEVGEAPHEAAASADGRTVVVCNYGGRTAGNTLSVVDMVRSKVSKTIGLGRYHRPHGVQFLPGGERVIVTTEQAGCVVLVDLSTGKVEREIKTHGKVSHMVALSRDGRRAFVANIGSGSISVLDLVKGELISNIKTGAGAEGIAVHPARDEVWVANRGADTVSIIDTEKLEVAATLRCGKFPIRVAFTPDGTHALVSCARSGEVAVFDAGTREELRRIPMQEKAVEARAGEQRLFAGSGSGPMPIGILVRPDGRRAYVANTLADKITVLDLERWKVIGTLTAGRQPDGMAWARAPSK